MSKTKHNPEKMGSKKFQHDTTGNVSRNRRAIRAMKRKSN